MNNLILNTTLTKEVSNFNISVYNDKYLIYMDLGDKCWYCEASTQEDEVPYLWLTFRDCDDKLLGSMDIDLSFIPYKVDDFQVSEYKNKSELYIFITPEFNYEEAHTLYEEGE
jgi:hypothetical protein